MPFRAHLWWTGDSSNWLQWLWIRFLRSLELRWLTWLWLDLRVSLSCSNLQYSPWVHHVPVTALPLTLMRKGQVHRFFLPILTNQVAPEGWWSLYNAIFLVMLGYTNCCITGCTTLHSTPWEVCYFLSRCTIGPKGVSAKHSTAVFL